MGILAPLVYSSSSLGYHETFKAGKSNLSENLLMILIYEECKSATIFDARCTKNEEELGALFLSVMSWTRAPFEFSFCPFLP